MTDQTRLPVGETRPPTVLANVRMIAMGDIVTLVMCAHRFGPEDLRGWHTHEPEAVIRGWVQENAEATVARLLGDRAQDHSTRSPMLAPLEERLQDMLDDRRDDTEQTQLVTDGGFEHTTRTATFTCEDCDEFELEKSYSGIADTPGEEEYDRIQAPETCPACGGSVTRDDVATDGGTRTNETLSAWKPATTDTAAPRCLNCGTQVTKQWARVFGDNRDVPHSCPDCATYRDMQDGDAADAGGDADAGE